MGSEKMFSPFKRCKSSNCKEEVDQNPVPTFGASFTLVTCNKPDSPLKQFVVKDKTISDRDVLENLVCDFQNFEAITDGTQNLMTKAKKASKALGNYTRINSVDQQQFQKFKSMFEDQISSSYCNNGNDTAFNSSQLGQNILFSNNNNTKRKSLLQEKGLKVPMKREEVGVAKRKLFQLNQKSPQQLFKQSQVRGDFQVQFDGNSNEVAAGMQPGFGQQSSE